MRASAASTCQKGKTVCDPDHMQNTLLDRARPRHDDVPSNRLWVIQKYLESTYATVVVRPESDPDFGHWR